MELLSSDYLVPIHYGLILAITCAQLLVVYFISASSIPPRGLGLFTVYFMAALMGWILFSLQQGPAANGVFLDTPAIAVLATSYLLFLAISQRAASHRGRYLLGALCLGACLSAFFVPPATMFAIQSAGAALFWAAGGAVSARQAWRGANAGDALIALAALVTVAGLAVTAWQWRGDGDLARAQALAFGLYGTAYALVIIGFLASVLLEYQQQLSHLSTRDPLTRLSNRRGLDEALRLSLAGAARNNSKTSAIMMDIDQFRQVNASFGHELGDRVIQTIAQLLEQSCRATDVVARVGGEEFLAILPGTDEEAARIVAERLRSLISDTPLEIDEQAVPISISQGVVTVEGATDLDQLHMDAERALQSAKRGGRNQVASLDGRPQHFSTAGTAPGGAS